MVRLPAFSQRSTRGVRRAIPAILACAALSLLLSACDFLTSDIFPSWLSYTDAVIDLRSLLYDQSGGAIEEPSVSDTSNFQIEYLQTVGGKAYIAIYFSYDSIRKLLILDSGDMRLLASLESSYFSNFLAADCAGNIVCGSVSISASDLATMTNYTIVLSYGSRQWLVRAGSTPQYVTQCDGSMVYHYKYESNWAAGSSLYSTIGIFSDPDFYPSASWTLKDAETDVAGTGSYWLFSNYYGSDTVGYVGYYSTTMGMEGILTSFIYNSSQKTGPFPIDEGWTWVTEGGPVAFKRNDNQSDRLVRYKFGTGGITYDSVNFYYIYTYSTELDSIPFDSDDKTVLSFDPAGKFWFYYDRNNGLLYKMRTWWK